MILLALLVSAIIMLGSYGAPTYTTPVYAARLSLLHRSSGHIRAEQPEAEEPSPDENSQDELRDAPMQKPQDRQSTPVPRPARASPNAPKSEPGAKPWKLRGTTSQPTLTRLPLEILADMILAQYCDRSSRLRFLRCVAMNGSAWTRPDKIPGDARPAKKTHPYLQLSSHRWWWDLARRSWLRREDVGPDAARRLLLLRRGVGHGDGRAEHEQQRSEPLELSTELGFVAVCVHQALNRLHISAAEMTAASRENRKRAADLSNFRLREVARSRSLAKTRGDGRNDDSDEQEREEMSLVVRKRRAQKEGERTGRKFHRILWHDLWQTWFAPLTSADGDLPAGVGLLQGVDDAPFLEGFELCPHGYDHLLRKAEKREREFWREVVAKTRTLGGPADRMASKIVRAMLSSSRKRGLLSLRSLLVRPDLASSAGAEVCERLARFAVAVPDVEDKQCPGTYTSRFAPGAPAACMFAENARPLATSDASRPQGRETAGVGAMVGHSMGCRKESALACFRAGSGARCAFLRFAFCKTHAREERA